VIISPLGYDSPIPSPMPLRQVVSQLRDRGSAVIVMVPDQASAAAIGANPLDPATRIPAAEAGLAQGRGGLADAG
jgi:NTE family protein